MNIKKIATLLIATTLGLILGGCATVRQVGSEVDTHSTLKSLPVAGYRFERLPSQQTPEQLNNQNALEAMAEKALALVGLKRNDAKPGYSVLIGATVLRNVNTVLMEPWPNTAMFSMNVGFGRSSRRGSISYGPAFPRYSIPYLRREVSVVLRDLSTGQVVYETHAIHDSPWADSDVILPVMFEAALSGFPTPPSERRIVNITLQAVPDASTATPTAPTPGTVQPAPTTAL
jgi:hypothetical protein